ncbi:hypothetical protein PG988_002273 [Apiospora saccharicola]
MASTITAQDIQALKGKMDQLAQFILMTQQRRDERHPHETERRNELDDYILDLNAKHSQAEADFIVTVTQHSVRGYTVRVAPVQPEGAHPVDAAVAAVATASSGRKRARVDTSSAGRKILRLNTAPAGRKRARVDTTVDELALSAQDNSKGYIIITAFSQVIHTDRMVDSFLKQNGNVGRSVAGVDKIRLDEALQLFAKLRTHSISHLPKQTQMVIESPPAPGPLPHRTDGWPHHCHRQAARGRHRHW